ncbi:MAG: PPC domain-containing protein [Acidobacteriota bacterium]
MKRLAYLLAAAALAPACATDDPFAGETIKSDPGKADASANGVFLTAELTGKLVTDYSWSDTQTIQDQLLYTVGQLNGLVAVGRIDRTEITNVQKTTTSDGKTQITYSAKMPIIWSKSHAVPDQLDLALPLDVSSAGQDAFTAKYKASCVDWGAHDVDSGSMFYYFRPSNSGCKLADADVVKTKAALTPSGTQTTGKFPEYDKVWEDKALNVVAIFGKYEDGATSGDAGIDGYNEFVGLMKSELGAHNLTTIPANVPADPGVSAPDIEFDATLADGRTVKVVALLTDNINTGLQDPTFRARYESLSTRADFIVYNGHAGLGSNIRALAGAGKWVAGQYVVVFMNGCDTFAYIDNSLSAAHQALNPDDTTGWKYIDIVNNGEPAFFASMAGASMAMFRGLMSYDAPMTYEQIFNNVDGSQLVMVTGEQDNAFTPGGGGQPQPWAGLKDHGTVARGATKTWTTPTLEAGTYEFDLTGTGDADLYVRIGSPPTLSKYDCRPYLNGSAETCTVTLSQPAPIGVMVNGYAASSTFDLVGKKQ